MQTAPATQPETPKPTRPRFNRRESLSAENVRCLSSIVCAQVTLEHEEKLAQRSEPYERHVRARIARLKIRADRIELTHRLVDMKPAERVEWMRERDEQRKSDWYAARAVTR